MNFYFKEAHFSLPFVVRLSNHELGIHPSTLRQIQGSGRTEFIRVEISA